MIHLNDVSTVKDYNGMQFMLNGIIYRVNLYVGNLFPLFYTAIILNASEELSKGKNADKITVSTGIPP